MYIEQLNFKTFMKYTIPAVLSMLFISLFTIVDGFFVSRYVGTDALASLNMTMPIYNIGFAVTIMLSVGGSALISMALGEGNKEKAYSRFSLISIVILLVTTMTAVLGLIFLNPLLRVLGVTPDLYDNAAIYARILLFAVPFLGIKVSYEYFMRVDDNANLSLILTVVGGLVNMILDYVFIAHFGWGIAGAGYATMLGIVVTAIIGVYHFLRKPKLLHYGKPSIDLKFLREASVNGLSEMVTDLSGVVTSILFNVTLISYAGASGVAANSVMMYLNFMFISIGLGVTMGVQPLISYNLGAKNYPVIKQIMKMSLGVLLSISVVIFGLIQVFGDAITGMFLKGDLATAALAGDGLKIFGFAILISSVNILASGYFTAINNGLISAIISFSRSIIFIVPIILVLPKHIGLTGIWMTIPLAEALTLLVVVFFVRRDNIISRHGARKNDKEALKAAS